jgi:hypothetical protein
LSDWPETPVLPLTVWTGDARHGLAAAIRAMVTSAAFGSTAWGTANLAIFTPIMLPYKYPMKNMFVYNFATVAGNVDIGIYSSEGTLVASAGGNVAMAGASTMQFFAVDKVLDPDLYYIGFVSSSTTATFGAAAAGTATRERYLGLLQQSLASTVLPASLTEATVGQARIPQVGFTRISGTPSF